jgi:GTPase involved in cell partitioning and DNA repair
VDIAGLVAGASKGEGLGNKFLAHIRNVSMILQVVRCFESEEGTEQVTHVEGTVDPARDMEIINTELLLADLESLTTARQKLEKRTKLDAESQKRLDLMQRTLAVLDEGQPARSVLISAEEWPTFNAFQLLTRYRASPFSRSVSVSHDLILARLVARRYITASRWCTAAMSRCASSLLWRTTSLVCNGRSWRFVLWLIAQATC